MMLQKASALIVGEEMNMEASFLKLLKTTMWISTVQIQMLAGFRIMPINT